MAVDGVDVPDAGELQSVFVEFRRARWEREPQMFIRADCRLPFTQVFKVLRAEGTVPIAVLFPFAGTNMGARTFFRRTAMNPPQSTDNAAFVGSRL